MRKVLVYSGLLLMGLLFSQLRPGFGQFDEPYSHGVKLLTMVGLGFIMIHVGQEFDLDKRNPRRYGWDYIVAMTAAAFPWVFVTGYFMFVLAPPEMLSNFGAWKEALLQGRFAAPTSAGVLFSMLAAAGLGATWVFKKARVLAIFDDLDTILLMVPLTVLFVGFRWQLLVLVAVIGVLLWVAWRFLHRWKIPHTWPWVLLYATGLAVLSDAVYLISGAFDPGAPIHFEVLLPAFVLGCVIAKPSHGLDELNGLEGQLPGPDARSEQRVASIISGAFMVLVGLSMPRLGAAAGGAAAAPMPWTTLALHVVAVTALSNLGKMFPAFCYRGEASLRQRLALSLCLFPRGEVGAGVLVVSLSYGISGAATTVALLSLALNLVLTGVFILWVKALIRQPQRGLRQLRRPELMEGGY